MKKGSVVMDNKGNSAYELASKFKKKYKMQEQHESHKDNRYIGMCGIFGSINSCVIIKKHRS